MSSENTLDFENIREWYIPDNTNNKVEVIQVIDSQNNIIWRKYYIIKYDDNK